MICSPIARRYFGRVLGAGILLATVFAPGATRAQALRFTTTAPGSVVGTGNTLGLSKAQNANGPGIQNSIGTFISLGATVDDMPANPGNPWPMGTTNDWTMNGSTAVLTFPVRAEILYAELLWGGSHTYAPEDVTAFLNTAVTLTKGATSASVTPDAATALTITEIAASGFAANYYMRSADVTGFVKAAGGGTYSVSGVPATQTTTINSLSAAGWTLVVAYRDESEPTRNLSVFVGGSFVDEDTQQDYSISGFCAPPAGVVDGTVVVSAIEGDADLVGDQLLIAPTAAGPFVGLAGPNNPANNFFCSQLNDKSGQLDTMGTFGTANQDAIGGTNIAGGRQGWDVTTVPLSSQNGQLQNGQTSAVIRTITTGDSYAPILAAFAIGVNAPDFTASGATLDKSADVVAVGDTLTMTATLQNQGAVTAESLVFTMPLESGLSLSSFEMDGASGDIGGNPVDGAGLASGVDAGDLPSAETRQVKVTLDVVGPPEGGTYFLQAKWDYGFQVCTGGNPLTESFSQTALVGFDAGSSTGGAGGSSANASTGMGGDIGVGVGAGAGGSGGGASQGHGANAGDEPRQVIDSESGCACTLPGGTGSRAAEGAWLGLMLTGLLLRGRRRAARA